jgi:hypothetical protein
MSRHWMLRVFCFLPAIVWAPADANVCTLADQPHRAPADLHYLNAFKQKVKAVFCNCGSREEREVTGVTALAEA